MGCINYVYPTFSHGGVTVTLNKYVTNHKQPLSFNQALEYTAAGTQRVETLGAPIIGHTILIEKISAEVYGQLVDFLKNEVNGAANQFVFTDGLGVPHNVRYIDGTFNFTPDQHQFWSGTFNMEEAT